jgi:hypothetical protein
MMSKPGTTFYQRNSVWIMAILIFLLPLVIVVAIKAKGRRLSWRTARAAWPTRRWQATARW